MLRRAGHRSTAMPQDKAAGWFRRLFDISAGLLGSVDQETIAALALLFGFRDPPRSLAAA